MFQAGVETDYHPVDNLRDGLLPEAFRFPTGGTLPDHAITGLWHGIGGNSTEAREPIASYN
jgi:hypothetical protein